jgi:NAD(P)-dependent dehydrogenase (short-subunit alcohol dehydrogenase family)
MLTEASGAAHAPLPATDKIAVLRANRIGDFVVTLPALAALRAAYPRAEIVLLGRRWHAEFLADRPGPIDRVVPIPPYHGVGEPEEHRDDPALLDPFFAAMTAERFDRTMRLNVAAPYFLTQAFARHWIPRRVAGRVLFVGSINGRLAEQDSTAYDTSKGAVEMMVKTLCVALAPEGIRVNGIAPGLVRTPQTRWIDERPEKARWIAHHTTTVLGARITPARCISPAWKISLDVEDGSWTVVTPKARCAIASQFCCGMRSSSPCEPWA